MYLVKINELNEKMRLARPVFNRKGELIYSYGTPISPTMISDLIKLSIPGVCIIEPTDNASAFTDKDVDFERFRSMSVAGITVELKEIVLTHRLHRIEYLVDEIINRFSGIKNFHFYQDLRSDSDYIFRHTFNVAVIGAIIANKVGFTINEKRRCIKACLVHDIGKTLVPPAFLETEEPNEVLRILDNSQDIGFEHIEELFPEETEIADICTQAHMVLTSYKFNRAKLPENMYKEASVLLVADWFETLSAIDFGGSGIQRSFASVLKELLDHPEVFDTRMVKILADTLELFRQGDNVILSDGHKALVMSVNVNAPLYPVVLDLSNNRMIDLSDRNSYGNLEVSSVAISTDIRHRMRQ